MLHQVGVGALGPVFRTYEPTRDRLVAVKVFRLDVTPEQAQALADELSAAADAGLFHPSIVEPIAAGVEGTVAYRAEEYVAAETLDVALRHYAPAPIDKVLPIITQLAGAIDFARTASVGHGALHPRDIFVTPEEARATGFGVVEALERVGLRAPVRRPYSAPERVSGGSWSTPADVFSLAAIAYELLTGRRPAGTGAQIGTVSGTSAGHHPGALHAVFVQAMDDDPARRYQTALGFASALAAAARGEAPLSTYEKMSTYEKGSPSVTPVAAAAPVVASLRRPDAILLNEVADEDVDEEAVDADQVDADEEVADDEVLADSDVEIHSERSLFDDEARLGDFPLDAPAATETQRFADEFSVAATDLRGSSAPFEEPADDLDPVDPLDEDVHEIEPSHQEAPGQRPGSTLFGHADVDDRSSHAYGSTSQLDAAEHDRPRTAVLPLVLAVVFGLLLGAAGVYAYYTMRGSGETAAVAGETASVPPPAAQQPAPPPTSFSEGTLGQGEKGAAPATPGGPPATAPAATVKPETRAKAGRLVVSSTPRGASVTVNGRWRGRTPFTMEDVPFGNVEVRVVQTGYRTQTERVTLSSDVPSRTLSFKLQRSAAATKPAASRPAASRPAAPPQSSKPQSFTGSVYIDSRPRGARVLLDGKAIGTTPMRISDIAVGSHIIKLQLEDHSDWTTSTRVVSGQETRVTGSLERIR